MELFCLCLRLVLTSFVLAKTRNLEAARIVSPTLTSPLIHPFRWLLKILKKHRLCWLVSSLPDSDCVRVLQNLPINLASTISPRRIFHYPRHNPCQCRFHFTPGNGMSRQRRSLIAV
ncbi:hypothetical protein FB45DRAFT_895505 [Roridomyces roridus]|uniref:Secreted protein n=1 Tax=Roridomyces roridus TaxID=1738132 RepID=A0AAD7FXF6_9AGAR|nr:hypothetical protein FB45DRAFT_895505 [Roridomyces roridus]